MSAYYQLDGTIIKNPTAFKTSKYNLTKSGRTASGKMKMRIIAVKRKFEFEYAVLDGTRHKQIDDILFGGSSFFAFEYLENGVVKTATVYAGAYSADRFRTDGIWYWKNVKFDLIEQ